MKIFKRNNIPKSFIKSSLVVFGIFLFLVTSLVISPKNVYAASGQSPKKLAQIWNAGLAYADCIWGGGIDSPQTESEIDEGGIIRGGTSSKVYVGYVVDTDDGEIKCGSRDDQLKLLEILDVTPKEFAKGTGLYEVKTVNGTVNYISKNENNGDRGLKVLKFIEEKFPEIDYGKYKDEVKKNKGRLSLTTGYDFKLMAKKAQYIALKSAWDQQCQATESSDGVEVNIVNGNTGEVTTQKVSIGQKEGNVVEVGFGIDGIGSDGKAACSRILAQMNLTYQAYSDDIKKAVREAGEGENPYIDTAQQGGGGAGSSGETCESTGGSQSWYQCPIIDGIAGALNWVDTQLVKLLEIDKTAYDTPELYQAWASFRNIALSLLIITMLVMVISTALGLDILDAYTIKKAMPRLLAAAIFMLLSWWICLALINLSNLVGKGVLGIMTAPFGDIGSSLQNLFSPSKVDGAISIGGFAIAAAAIVAFPQVLTILGTWLGMALLVVGLALIVLVARQMFILVSIILAPIAIVSWIFPGNDKMWKLWWQTFSKLLIMYPMIMALIGAGRIFAHIIQIDPAQNNIFGTILKLTAYVIPYAFIPLTFKVAGGVFGNLAGMVNDKSRGGFDRLRKVRQNSYKKMGENAKTGQLVRGRGKIAGAVNRRARGVTHGVKGGFGFGTRGQVADDEVGMVQSQEHMKTAEWQGAKFKDDAMRMLTHNNEADAIAELRARNPNMSEADIQANIRSARNIGYSRTSQLAAAQQLAMNKTGYDDAADAMDVVHRVSNGSDPLNGSLRENIKFTSKQVGRNDMGALRERAAGEDRQHWNNNMTSEGFEGIDTFSLGREHKNSYKNMAKAHEEQYAEATRAYVAQGGQTPMNEAAVIAARTRLEETMKNASAATGVNAREAFGLGDRIAGADEEIRRVSSIPATDQQGNPIRDANGNPMTFSPILGLQSELPIQGAVQGSVGSGGTARAQDARFADEATRRNQQNQQNQQGP